MQNPPLEVGPDVDEMGSYGLLVIQRESAHTLIEKTRWERSVIWSSNQPAGKKASEAFR
jgi:hypothetical protein